MRIEVVKINMPTYWSGIMYLGRWQRSLYKCTIGTQNKCRVQSVIKNRCLCPLREFPEECRTSIRNQNHIKNDIARLFRIWNEKTTNQRNISESHLFRISLLWYNYRWEVLFVPKCCVHLFRNDCFQLEQSDLMII